MAVRLGAPDCLECGWEFSAHDRDTGACWPTFPESTTYFQSRMIVKIVREGDEGVIEAEVPDSQESDLAAWASSPNLLEGYP